MLPHGLGDAEVDDLGDGRTVVQRYQDVRGLQVAVNDAFLMGVLHGLAYVEKQPQTVANDEVTFVAEFGDRRSADQLHDEIGSIARSFAGVQNPCDILMLHQGQRLPLGLESSDHTAGVHARFEHFQCDFAANGPLLLGHKNDAEPAFPDLFQ